MEDLDHFDYEAELERFSHILQSNKSTLQRTLNATQMETSSRLQQHRKNILNVKEKLDRAKQRVEEMQQQISQREAEGCQAREEAERMTRELEVAALALQGKKEEVERHKETLADCVERVRKKEQWASETRQRNQQGKVSLAESSVELFTTHLGLDISCTNHNTFVFKFSQVSRTNPEAEYLLEVSLEGDTYQLLNSEPPLPCLSQLQDALAATGNLTACLVQIRRLYQRADSKRQLE